MEGLRGGGRSAGGGGGSCIKNSGNIWLFPEEFYNSNGTQNRHEYLHITSELIFMGDLGGGGGRALSFWFLYSERTGQKCLKLANAVPRSCTIQLGPSAVVG